MLDYSTFISLLCLLTGLASASVLITIIVFWFTSKTTRDFFVRMNNLNKEWIVLQFVSKILRPFMKTYEPSIPSSGMVQIGNCTVYLARLVKKPSMYRINQETLCLIDLYYHQKRISQGLVSLGPKLVTAVSEEAYLQTQLLMQSDSYLYFTFSKAIQDYLNYVRFSSNALQSYCPTSEYVYFSQDV